jgi:hypothetical protein
MLFGISFNRFVHLVGWLPIYPSGYLHRDISNGNILIADKPVKRKRFKIPKEFENHLVVAGPESGGSDQGAVHAS